MVFYKQIAERRCKMKIPDNIIPLVYFIAVCLAAFGLKLAIVDPTTIGMIIGAGLMRVKIPAPPPAP